MTPAIRVDDDVFDHLKKHAEPLVDTPNSVLRRLFGLPDGAKVTVENLAADVQDAQVLEPTTRSRTRSSRRRAARSSPAKRAQPGTILPDEEYEVPILAILAERGGRAPTREVIDALGDRLNGRLTPTDHDRLTSGDIRWRNRAQFVRLSLIERGEMVKGSPRGVWEISERGRTRLEDEK